MRGFLGREELHPDRPPGISTINLHHMIKNSILSVTHLTQMPSAIAY